MTATTLFYLLVCLVLGIWALVIISFWYARKLLQRQSVLASQLIPYLKQIQKERDTIQALSIPDTTPLSKLQGMTLPDNVNIDFQHQPPLK